HERVFGRRGRRRTGAGRASLGGAVGIPVHGRARVDGAIDLDDVEDALDVESPESIRLDVEGGDADQAPLDDDVAGGDRRAGRVIDLPADGTVSRLSHGSILEN